MGEIGPEVILADAAFVHPSAHLYGKVRIGKGASVWINAAARAELHDIAIGAYSNVQDFAMLHVGAEHGTTVGEFCSITHHATLHGCTIEDHCLIGINATVMDGAVIGSGSIIAGHTIVGEDTIIPPNSIVRGVPGKVTATRDNRAANRWNALFYHLIALAYAQGLHRLDLDRVGPAEIVKEFEQLTAALARDPSSPIAPTVDRI